MSDKSHWERLYILGIDTDGTQVYTASPSGIYRSFKAYAMGNGEATAREYLRDNYSKDLGFDQIIHLCLDALKEAIDEEATKENVRLSYIKAKDKRFIVASKDEIEQYLTDIK
jgi:20S proteasome alpha/beta subunit